MAELKLKPCPFCGSKAIAHLDGGNSAVIRCTKSTCSCKQQMILGSHALYETIIETFEVLVKKWNTRPAELSE